jgi:predicted dehydrogenase
MPELNIGMVGFGNMGKAHAYAIRNLPYYFGTLPFKAAVTGVCTTSYDRACAIAQEYSLGTPAHDFEELIARDDIDIIDICTPNTLHVDMICRALLAGKHVLCEKPLCVTMEEAARIVRCERESDRICGIVFNNRFMAPMLRAKQLISEGRLGRILSFRVYYEHNSSTFAERSPGWKQTAEHGGGVLFDLGSHIIDLVRYLCGDFESVQGMSQIAFPTHGDWQTDADEAFYITAKLKCGACGSIVANKLATGANDDLSLAIFGERGSIKYELMEPEWLYFYDNDRPASPIGGERGFTRIECGGRYPAPGGVFPSPKASVGWLRCHIESMVQYLSAVASGIPFAPSLADGAYVQAVMQAALDSDKNGGIRTEVIAP